MFWIIFGIIVVIIAAVVGFRSGSNFFEPFGHAVLYAVIALIMYALFVSLVCLKTIGNHDNMEFEISKEEKYEILKMNDGSYYNSIAYQENHKISFAQKKEDGTYEEKTLVTKILTINPYAAEASVVIKYEKPVSVAFMWDKKTLAQMKEGYWIDVSHIENIKEIIINIPDKNSNASASNNDIAENQSGINEDTPGDAFCSNCGNSVKEDWMYCTKCGEKLGK